MPFIDDSRILLEPQRRNTAPSIAWSSYHIRAINKDANIVVAPVDHLILNESEFSECINKSFAMASTRDVLVTLGINPTRVETGFGYIQMDDETVNGFYKVKTYNEKHESELAKIFIDSGEFLWNSGIFIWNVNTIIKAFEKYLPEVSSHFESDLNVYGTDKEMDFIDNVFPSCPSISIDFGVIEKASNVFVLPSKFGWSDMGSWGSLYINSHKDENNNACQSDNVISYESSNNIVSLPDGHIAVIQGLDDYIIAESGDVLLICQKKEEQRIRKFVIDAKVKFGDKYI